MTLRMSTTTFHHHRDWSGEVRYIQILRDAVGTYWLYIVTDDATPQPYLATGESVGVDFGMASYLTLNTGEKIQGVGLLLHKRFT